MAKRKEPDLDVEKIALREPDLSFLDEGTDLRDVKIPSEKISCMARTVECYENNGFRNMRVVTLFIEDGVIVRTKRSDPWQAFELIAKLDVANHMDVLYLNGQWVDKKTISERPNALPNEIMF